MIKVEKFLYNDFDDLNANTYVAYDDKNNAIVIDPSVDNDSISGFINRHNLTLKAILLTHGHFDHIRGVDRLVKEFKAPLYIHFDEEDYLKDSYLNCSHFEGEFIVESTPITVSDNEILKIFDEDDIKVIHTPFHTRGSVCYYFINNKLLFSGDTLFKMSVGRDDLPGAIPSKRRESLEKIKTLPIETKIYPGHGPNTVLKTEIEFNHFLRY